MSDIEDISSGTSSVECKVQGYSFSKHVKPDEDAMNMFMDEFLEKTQGLGSKGLIDRVFKLAPVRRLERASEHVCACARAFDSRVTEQSA